MLHMLIRAVSYKSCEDGMNLSPIHDPPPTQGNRPLSDCQPSSTVKVYVHEEISEARVLWHLLRSECLPSLGIHCHFHLPRWITHNNARESFWKRLVFFLWYNAGLLPQFIIYATPCWSCSEHLNRCFKKSSGQWLVEFKPVFGLPSYLW